MLVLFSAAIAAIVPFILGWIALSPRDDDPRSIQYILWKHGLKHMDPDHALAAFYQDPDRDNFVHGLTQDELKTRFGYLKSFNEVTPYYQACYSAPTQYPIKIQAPTNGKEVVFLRDSSWMVVLNHGRAEKAVLCKGY